MPAYSFKERFVPMVKDGSKTHTIRAFRSHPVSAGQMAHLYYGMRTKFCTKLLPACPIPKVECIAIFPCGNVWIITTNWLDEDQRRQLLHGKFQARGVQITTLSETAKDELAWADGFRHQEDPATRAGCFEIMVRFWTLTHELPFIGNLIHWK